MVMIYPKRGNGNDGDVIGGKIYIRKVKGILRSYFNSFSYLSLCLVATKERRLPQRTPQHLK